MEEPEEYIEKEISLQGEPEEVEERFAQVLSELPRIYEVINSVCVKDIYGYPEKAILKFERKH